MHSNYAVILRKKIRHICTRFCDYSYCFLCKIMDICSFSHSHIWWQHGSMIDKARISVCRTKGNNNGQSPVWNCWNNWWLDLPSWCCLSLPIPRATPPFLDDRTNRRPCTGSGSLLSGRYPYPSQQKILASYLHQYVSRAVLLPGIKRDLFLQKIARLRSQHEFESFADELAAVGIEPF